MINLVHFVFSMCCIYGLTFSAQFPASCTVFIGPAEVQPLFAASDRLCGENMHI